jgi:hypothetical protein
MNATMEELALSFHGLRAADGVRPFDAETLDAWACGPAPGSGALNAARFVLSVWNSRAKWRCGRFDVVDALSCWDAEHRAAFLAWAQEPCWP